MSKFCQIIHAVLDKCQCFVQGLSKICLIFATLSNQLYTDENLQKFMCNTCPTFVQQNGFWGPEEVKTW